VDELMPPITWRHLAAVLEDFRDWYEFEWLGEKPIIDRGMSAIQFYMQMKRKDPVWPDRPPEVLYAL